MCSEDQERGQEDDGRTGETVDGGEEVVSSCGGAEEGRQRDTVSTLTISMGETGMTVMRGVAWRCCEKILASYFE